MLVGVVSYSRGPTGESCDVISDKRIRCHRWLAAVGHISRCSAPSSTRSAQEPNRTSYPTRAPGARGPWAMALACDCKPAGSSRAHRHRTPKRTKLSWPHRPISMYPTQTLNPIHGPYTHRGARRPYPINFPTTRRTTGPFIPAFPSPALPLPLPRPRPRPRCSSSLVL